MNPVDTRDLRTVALRFYDYVDTVLPPRGDPGPTSFYYPNDPSFNSIQSTFLWGYTCIVCATTNSFPWFHGGEVDALAAAGTRNLVILGKTRAGVATAQDNASRLSPPFVPLREPVSVGEGTVDAWVAISRRNG